MRILQLDSGREMRGGQWQVLYLAQQLRESGHDVTLLCPPGSPLAIRARQCGIVVERLSLGRVFRLSRQFQVTHAHDARTHTMAALSLAPRLVVSRRVGFPVRRSPASRWKYSRPSLYLAVSRFVRQRLLDAGVADSKIRVVYDGVPALPVLEPGPRIVALDSPDPGKGAELLKRAAASCGVEVRFSNDLSADLPGAGMLVYLSYQEGLGSAALMAHAARVPVIASRAGGLLEAVEHNRTGLLVENRAGCVADAIRRLRQDPALALRLAVAGHEEYLRRFRVETMAAATLAAYREVSV